MINQIVTKYLRNDLCPTAKNVIIKVPLILHATKNII